MRKTMNISVSDELLSYIRERGGSGRYDSVSDYIRSLVERDRSDEIHKTKPYPRPRRANEYFTMSEDELDQD